ncbi:sensor histidine kinase [Microbacterium telephonicum]|uniref:histidine kinase n=1 Tax=Microbacterium telephonicum TaxID=1714841 RepID=A0A498BSZ1_9MICO|nr:sensor histidine kinase [Microbacterium telephonicum]RLK46622.1 signal transduction histidine kinase [Microbacterium telephonicum]
MTDQPRRPRPTAAGLRGDILLAGVLFVAAVISVALGQIAGIYGDDVPHLMWGLAYGAALTLPLAVRRRFPEVVLLVVAVAFFVGVTFRIPEVYVGNVAVFIAMYTVGAWVDDRRRATLVRLIVIGGMFVWLTVVTFQAATVDDESGLSRAGLFSPFAAYMLMNFLVNAGFFGGAYYFGERAYAQAMQQTALRARTDELERERELTAAQAVALDRVRIARELHDVVAHHVSAMGVQAGAARTVLDRDPAAARQALVGVEESARSALAELRQLLETLRTPDAASPDDPTLRLTALPDLVVHANENGLPTSFDIVGDPREVPEIVQVNLYRITQEALTNARRHGSADAVADVRLRYTDAAVEVEITNTGRVQPGRAGLGIVGMRERAAASGGTIEVGPRDRGGFLVRVRVPLAPPPDTDGGSAAIAAAAASAAAGVVA